jgi:4,4'-diaponeurosporenoate glycosyltransferase
VTGAWFELRPAAASTALFVIGWSCGWLLLCRPRRLVRVPTPVDGAPRRSPVSVIVPARNEAAVIGELVMMLQLQRHDGDEVIVVDDHSTDDTADLARRAGATVIAAPALPDGWAGKPHACAVGAAAAVNATLVFVDADVTPGPGLLDALAATVADHRRSLVSVQPWHRTVRPYEQLSLLFNLTALMGSAAFSIAGRRVACSVAFGPVLACDRLRYDELGGHAHPEVRGAILEDIALARRFGSTAVFVGGPGDVRFRMYPAGLRQLVEGWTKGVGIGFDATPWWATVAVAAWISSLAGGWSTSPWFALASLLQLAVLARVAGRFSPLAILAYPVLVAAFVVILLRSLLRRHLGRSVTWKGRRVMPDQSTG